MDSPVFGNPTFSISHNNNRKSFTHETDQQNIKNLYVLIKLQSQIQKFVHLLYKKIIMRNKRQTFHRMLEVANQSKLQCSTQQKVINNCVLYTENKVKNITRIAKKIQLKYKIFAFNKIKILSFSMNLQENFTPVSHNQKKISYDIQTVGKQRSKLKKAQNSSHQDIKQNSISNYESQDISDQNRKLRIQIMNQEYQQEHFFQKMMVLLDSHQKILTKGTNQTKNKKK